MNDTEGGDSGDDNLNKVILGVYFTSSVFTFIECLFAVYISIRNVNLRRRPSKYFSYNLVLSVGLLSTLSLSYGAVLLFIPSASYVSIYGCFIRVIQRCLSTVSCLMLTCLALDRYVSICCPLRYFHLISEGKCGVLSVVCWVSGFLLPILPCANQLKTFCRDGHSNLTFLISYTVVYNLGAFSMLVFYVLVLREFRHHPQKQHQNKVLAEAEAIVRLKTAKSALRVLLLYSLLSLPHMILPLASRLFGWTGVPRSVYHLCHLLHRLHLLLFLPMYVWANADSHEVLTASFKKICRRISCCKSKGMPQVKSQGVVTRCLSGFFCFLYEFFCCPSEDKTRRLRLDEEFSQVSTLSTDSSAESKF